MGSKIRNRSPRSRLNIPPPAPLIEMLIYSKKIRIFIFDLNNDVKLINPINKKTEVISNLLLIDELNTLKHVKSLAFNRPASSTGETQARIYIEKELANENVDSKIEYFSWAGPTRIFMRISYLIILIYLLLSHLILIVLVYFVIKNVSERTRNKSLIKNEQSKNILAEIKSIEEGERKPLVIFTAHYDTISANIPYRIQWLIFFTYKLIIGFYIIIMIIFSTWLTLDFLSVIILPENVIIIIAYLSLIGIVISIPILYLIFNKTPTSGSIDNASGVSILIELSKLFKRNPLNKMNVLFLWLGAEEWGMKGSKEFCKRHFFYLNQKYDLDRSILINIDMVGSYIGLIDRIGLFRKRWNKNLNDILKNTARNQNIPLIRYNKLFGLQSDHKNFRNYARRFRKTLQIACFHSQRDIKYIHSKKDTPDKCSVEILNGCLNICHQAIRSIDLRVE